MHISESASFITPMFASGGAEDPAVYFRREFTVDALPQRATLSLTALGVVEPHLNGGVVGDEVLAPGWTSYENRLIVSSHDITDLIVDGANALGFVVGEGWAAGRLGWADQRNHYTDRLAVLAEVRLEYGDRTETISTDRTFKASSGPIRENSIYDGESYDARLECPGWDQPGFEDSQWQAVEHFDWVPGTLEEPIAEPIRRIAELKPVEILTTPAGHTVVDFGQNISGWVRITVDGARGEAITLRHAEVMVGGEIDPLTLRTAKATDQYTLRGGGPETWEPRFTFHGFRYVQVDGWPGEITAEVISAVVIHSDMERIGWLETSNPLLNQLHSNAVWSMRGNFVGLPTDCPQRDERLGWTGDINAFGPSAAFLYDVRGVLGSWLRDLALEQAVAGTVPWIVPNVLKMPASPTALWSDVAISLPWAMYREYGDSAILAAAYDSMTGLMRQISEKLDENGLWSAGYQFGDWLDPDAPNENPAGGKTDAHLVAAAYLCKTTKELAQTATILGKTADAAEFAALSARVREAFRAEYVSANGRVAGETVTAYALAIAFEILDDEQRQHAGNLLARLVTEAGFRISTGFAGTPLVTDALSSTGHLAEAYSMLLETGCPSFLYPVTMGATTIWERWDSIRPDGTLNPSGMTSMNHYALGAVVDWMHRSIGGLRAVEPGYRTMRIAPLPGGDLSHATLRHTTVHGPVNIAWRIEGGAMTVDVSIPAGTTAEIHLPLHPQQLVEDISAGTHSWEYQLPDEADGGPRVYNFDTTLKVLAEDTGAWTLFTDAFAAHFPGVPLDGTAPEAAAITVAGLLNLVPGVSPELRTDLATALTTASTQGALS